MLELAVVLGLPAAIAAPHLLPLHRVTPIWAAAVWMLSLALRALVAIGGAVFVFVYLPQTDLFRAIAEWCWHEVLPLIAAHLGLSGHALAHIAVVLPGLALAASLLWLSFGLVRGWLALRRMLSAVLGEGPLGATVVEGNDIVVAVSGLGRRRIVVSDAAVAAMDPDELAASLAHEHGHLERRHRPLRLLAAVLAALARPLPGTRNAERELIFHIERDADEYAVARTRDPLALASAICKAAGAPVLGELVSLQGKGRVTRRLGYLVGGAPSRGSALLERSTRVLAGVLAVLTLALTVSLPAWALTAPADARVSISVNCPH